MPTTYTHYRFGDQCRAFLPPEQAAAVDRYRSLYDTGVHGPDLLFYYHPLVPNQVSALGSRMHRLPARDFFEKARKAGAGEDRQGAMLAYLLGFLSHFVLDSACHGYVEEARRELGISHNRLEAFLDAWMMEQDSLNPPGVNRGFSLRPSEGSAAVIARFYEVPKKQILKAQKGQVWVMNLLYSPRGVKKRMLQGLIKGLHIPGSFDDLFIEKEIPGECRGAVEKLAELYEQALTEYGPLAKQLTEYLRGAGRLSERFDRDFE